MKSMEEYWAVTQVTGTGSIVDRGDNHNKPHSVIPYPSIMLNLSTLLKIFKGTLRILQLIIIQSIS